MQNGEGNVAVEMAIEIKTPTPYPLLGMETMINLCIFAYVYAVKRSLANNKIRYVFCMMCGLYVCGRICQTKDVRFECEHFYYGF